MVRLLLVDNYDSFTYNLVQAFLVLGAEVHTHRNDALTLQEAIDLDPTHVCISPGPGRPEDSGVSLPILEHFMGQKPVLGVCLGHQAIAMLSGATVGRAPRLMHGKSSDVFHDRKTIYEGLSNPFQAGRYHSLAVVEHTLPESYQVSSYTSRGEVMGIRHVSQAIEGVQFHPESILSPEGPKLLANFLKMEANNAGA